MRFKMYHCNYRQESYELVLGICTEHDDAYYQECIPTF